MNTASQCAYSLNYNECREWNQVVAFHLIQWNCRGPLQNLDDIHFFLDHLRSRAIYLQEGNLNDSNRNFLRRLTRFRKDRTDTRHSSGGVAIIVQRGIACNEICLATHLEADHFAFFLIAMSPCADCTFHRIYDYALKAFTDSLRNFHHYFHF